MSPLGQQRTQWLRPIVRSNDGLCEGGPHSALHPKLEVRAEHAPATFGFRRATSAGSTIPVLPSPFSVLRENVIFCLHDRVAREPALGVVRLRRLVGLGAGRERTGRGVIIEHGPSPSAAVREPLAVLHHEVHVCSVPGTVVSGKYWFIFGVQWIFAILAPSGKGLPL